MNTRIFTSFFVAVAFSPVLAEPVATYPALLVDNAHLQLKQADGIKPIEYVLTPTRGIVLDASGYKFEIPAQLKVDGPNSIQVLVGQNRKYSADWNPRSETQILDATSLKPLGGSPPFTGFQPGDDVVIGIGHGRVDGATLKFSVMWVGIAKVQ